MAAAHPSGTNTYIADWDSTGKLQTSYSRNPSDFALNKYCTLTPVTKNRAYYMRVTAEVAARIINDQDYIWPDGNVEPDDNDEQESFEFVPIETRRRAYKFAVGYQAAEQSDWKIVAAYSKFMAQKAMTNRTLRILEAGLTAANYDASHVMTATAAGGDFWTAGTGANPVIKKSLDKAVDTVLTDTLGQVDNESLVLVLSPTLAFSISESPELHEFVKSSPFARDQITGKIMGRNARFGLPESLYGVDVVVEKTVRVTSRKGASSATKTYAMDSNKALLVARPGELVGVEGAPSFSTLHCFMREEMTVETKDDPDNRRKKGRIVEDFDAYVVAPASGFLFTNCRS